jgi:hypothetical protein
MDLQPTLFSGASIRKTVGMSQWLGVVIAALALVLSAATWFSQYRRRVLAERRADVTVSFHWLTESAEVYIPDRDPLMAGYHLVLANRGPAAARCVRLTLKDSNGQRLKLLDVAPDEFPLRTLDSDGQYPIPWLYEPFTRHARRFEATVGWTDDAGSHLRTVPLRRGQLPS